MGTRSGRHGSAGGPAPARARALSAILALLAGLSWCGPAGAEAPPAQDGPSITWSVYEAGPFMMLDGPERGTGIFDRIRGLLAERLGDVSQRTISAPFPRLLAEIRNGADWCFVGGIRTPEREAFAAFSLPVAMFYPLRVIVHAPQRARFEALGPIPLARLLEDGTAWRTSVLLGRSLAPAVDALLRARPPAQTFSEFPEAFRMLLRDRLDYLIEFPSIAAYHARHLQADGALVALPLSETPDPVFSRVMCARTPQGLAVVARIDAILRAERPNPAYRAIVEAWSDPADLPKLRAIYDARFLTSD
ncbi:transporter substrate-binding domain-containing protein [Methylobacterium dankookense]|nr:transporter substrate-binding domain-containing protein [Methylobacterium dankookense]